MTSVQNSVLHTCLCLCYNKNMRKEKIIQGEYYHVFNRGNNKQDIFKDERDWIRLLFLVLYFQSPANLRNISRQVSYFAKKGTFNLSQNMIKEIVDNRYINLVAFTFTPNHFHLILHELSQGGISQYMKRILGGYTKYFNAKNETSGHLFQGPFKLVHIKNDAQIIYLSAYIHCNIREKKEWRGKECLFPYSSFKDYLGENRWGELLKADIIRNQFPDAKKYKLFVENSGAKDVQNRVLHI